ncbi:MAG: hypothetical protein R6U40_05185, partial [Desulfobacterales bacterium]
VINSNPILKAGCFVNNSVIDNGWGPLVEKAGRTSAPEQAEAAGEADAGDQPVPLAQLPPDEMLDTAEKRSKNCLPRGSRTRINRSEKFARNMRSILSFQFLIMTAR